jgi:hypothetical protein
VVTVAQIRAIAGPLPRTAEVLIRDQVKFRVRGIVYVAISADETTMGFGFPKEERAALVEAEPELFLLPRVSDLTFHWVIANLASLDPHRMRELVLDAWQMVVPKKVAREYWASTGEGTLTPDAG